MKRIDTNLYQHENGTYYTLHRVGSRQFKKSLRTRDRMFAKRLLRAERLNPGAPAASAETPSSTLERPRFEEAVTLHEHNTAFASRATAANFATQRRTMLRFCDCWENFQPVAIWKRYDAEGQGKKQQDSSSAGWVSAPNHLRWYLRSFSSFCVNRGWLSATDVSGRIPRKIVPARRVKIPTSEAMRDLLAMCESESPELGQFLRWIACSGLRLKGAAGIRWEDIDFRAGEYRRVMKGGAEVIIPLLPEALSLLTARRAALGHPLSGRVFEIGDYRVKRVRRLLRKYAVGLGLDLTYPHALRHHFASVAFASGFSPGEVAQMLGHKDGGTLALRVYGHVIATQLKTKVAQLRIAA